MPCANYARRKSGEFVIAMSTPCAIPIGIDDFSAMRAQALTYVDHSRLICALIDRPGARVVRLQRPPGFGKSLSLSLLRCFFESSERDAGVWFDQFAVWHAGERYRAHFQRYPVIHLRLGNLTCPTLKGLHWALHETVRDLIDEHRAALPSAALSGLDRERVGHLLSGSAPDDLYQRGLLELSRILHRVHGEPVILLIDDCDRPILAGLAHGYGREAMALIHALLGFGLSQNPHLVRAVVTHTVLFTDDVVTGLERTLSWSPLAAPPSPATVFDGSDEHTLICGFGGFREPELAPLLESTDRIDRLTDLQHWYGGHHGGAHALYRPDAIMHFLGDGAARTGPQLSGGVLTRVIHQLIDRDINHLRPQLESLLAGDTIELSVAHAASMNALMSDPDQVWYLLACAGWVRVTPHPRVGTGPDVHTITLTNRNAHAELMAALPSPARAPRSTNSAPMAASVGPTAIATRTARPRAPVHGADQDTPLPDSTIGRRPGRPDIELDADAFENQLSQFFSNLQSAPNSAADPAGDDEAEIPPTNRDRPASKDTDNDAASTQDRAVDSARDKAGNSPQSRVDSAEGECEGGAT